MSKEIIERIEREIRESKDLRSKLYAKAEAVQEHINNLESLKFDIEAMLEPKDKDGAIKEMSTEILQPA